MNALQLLLAAVIVLHSGDRLPVDDGSLARADDVVTFRSGGVLFSLPLSEIASISEDPAPAPPPAPVRRLRFSSEERSRLLAELATNRGGTPPAPPPTYTPPSEAERAQRTRDEWTWRREARAFEEGVRRAKEDLQLLEEKVARLEEEIRVLTGRGFKPRQFTWQTTQLAYTIERLPQARLEVVRAERAYEQFREDARRQGVLPGWLR